MKKRILSMMLAIAMVLSMLSGIALTSSAADGDKVYTLVTDASTLAAGDEILFVSAVADNDSYYAMKAYESGNNVKVEAVTVVGETITLAADSAACRYVLGGEAGAWTFFDGANYLFTSGTDKNQLQAKAEVDEYATWTIEITEGVTAITNVGNTSRGVMQYNSSSDLFACYASTSQKGVNIYKLSEGTAVCTHPNATSEETVAATCTANGEIAWSCPDCEATWTETTPKAAHSNEETVITPATCTAAGVKNLTCTVCGSVLEVTIPALGHNYVDGVCANCGEAEPADKAFVPVTNVANLKAGDQIIFVSAEAMADGNYYAMLTYVSGNNVKSVAVTPAEDGSITATSENGIGVYTLGGEAGAWTFFDGTNYLYTNNTTANRLLGYTELDEYGYWTIEMVEGVMSINNVANTERGMLQLNYSSSSQLFSCYNKAYKAVTIYKLSDGTPVCAHANATSQETVAPTCEAEGELTWTCPDCEETWTEAVPAIGHSFDEGVETTAPTCETAGVMTYTCTVCGATKTEEVAALGHNYEGGVCTICGAAQPAGKQYVLVTDAADLVAGDEIIIVAAEADNEVFYAMKAYASGNNVKGEAVTIDGTVISLEQGSAVCAYILGGEAGAWTFFDGTNYLYTDATTANRLQAKAELDAYCTWNIDITEGITSITNVANTERGLMQYNAGSDLFACYASATQKAVVIYKLNDGEAFCTHPNATSEETVAATCTEAGERTWTCADCGKTWKEIIPALGHSNDEGVVTTEPTCEATGVMTYTCTVCGSQKTETIPALGHNYVDGTCTNCGEAIPADQKYVLVTDPATLTAGDEIIFVSAVADSDGNYHAMLAYASGNNIKTEVVTVVDGTITLAGESAVRAYTLGGETGAWTFFDGAKYLYTNATTANRLQAQAELDEYGYWAIELVDGVMTVTNVANTSRGVMQYNVSSDLFACYSSASQEAVAIYKLNAGAVAPECTHANATSEETVAPTCDAEGELTYTCADCGKTWTEAVPALGHNYVGTETTAPTCDVAGVMTYACTVCGAVEKTEEIPALGHNYVDGTCTNCGDTLVVAPSVDETIKIFHTLDLASDISITFAVLKSAMANYDTYYLECVLPEYSGNELVGTSVVQIEPVVKGSYYYFTLTGITAIRMGDMVEAVLHMTKDGAEYISLTDSYSVSTYAYAMMEKSTDSYMLTLCADLLRYGAQAQSYKNYRTDALVDAAMTEEQKAYLSDTSALTFAETDSFLGDIESPALPWVGKTLDLASKVGLKFVFNAINYTGDINSLTMKVTYEGSNGEMKTVVLEGPEAYSVTATRKYYAFTFYGLLASELRTAVEVAVFEGETQLTETLRYSAETYAAKNTAGALAELCKALFAYSDSAKAYFAK